MTNTTFKKFLFPLWYCFLVTLLSILLLFLKFGFIFLVFTDFGLSAKCHQEMLTKLVTAITIKDVSIFEQKVLSFKSDLLEYINYQLVPPEQAYFLTHLIGKVAQVSNKDELVLILCNFCQSVFLREQLSVHFMTWRKSKSTKELKEIAASCLMIFERTLRKFPIALQQVNFADLRKLVDFLKDKQLSIRVCVHVNCSPTVNFNCFYLALNISG